MKNFLRKIFSFILNQFECGEGDYAYKPLNRKILLIVGILFLSLASIIISLSGLSEGYGFIIPTLIFSAVSLVCLVVGALGSDRAVAKIWGSR